MNRVRFVYIGFLMVAILAGIFHPAIAADATVQKAAVTIEAGEIGEPISKYIYGQFIEHQGRCIYGGIWAEMLEDRKFYYPVGTQKSPWKIIGFQENIVMTGKKSFVGEHTPQVSVDGQSSQGIMQDGLSLRKGTKYKGYIALAGSDSVMVEVGLLWWPGRGDKQIISIKNLTGEYTKIP